MCLAVIDAIGKFALAVVMMHTRNVCGQLLKRLEDTFGNIASHTEGRTTHFLTK